MTELVDDADAPVAKKSKMPLILGIVLALIGGGGGFFAVSQGIILGGDSEEATETDEEIEAEALDVAPLDLVFVALDPLVISVRDPSGQGHLRFSAQLDVVPQYAAEVEALKPRIVDVLNGYLRAVTFAEMSDPNALAKLRSQMLRRIQVVTGDGRVKDLLVMEFVLN